MSKIIKRIFRKFSSLSQTNQDSDYVKFTPIIQTADMNKIMLAKSILQNAEIFYNVKNENLQNLFAVGQYSTSINPLIGLMVIEVPAEQAEAAYTLLKPLFEPEQA